MEGEVSQVLESGLPPLHTSNKCQIQDLKKEGTPPLKGVGCHLSKRGALPQKHMSKSSKHLINQLSIKSSLSPLTLTLTFVPLLQLKHVPTCSFIFALADFY
jgi:hypothetical protein